jgi:hypothetical protein
VLVYYFERFLTEYEGRFEKEYGYFRPVIEVFVREVLRLLVDRGLLSPEWVERAADLERGGVCPGLTASAVVRSDKSASLDSARRILSS